MGRNRGLKPRVGGGLMSGDSGVDQNPLAPRRPLDETMALADI